MLAGCSAVPDERSGPTSPEAEVPPVTFRSAFENYRPFADQDLQDWRRANEEVGAAGGHAGLQRPSKPEPGR